MTRVFCAQIECALSYESLSDAHLEHGLDVVALTKRATDAAEKIAPESSWRHVRDHMEYDDPKTGVAYFLHVWEVKLVC